MSRNDSTSRNPRNENAAQRDEPNHESTVNCIQNFNELPLNRAEVAAVWKEEFDFDLSELDDLQDEILDTEVSETESTLQEKPQPKKIPKPPPPPELELPSDLIDEARKLAE